MLLISLTECICDMSEAKPCPATCISGSKLSKFDGDPLDNPTMVVLVGALQYVT
jgi:hypothetical protein